MNASDKTLPQRVEEKLRQMIAKGALSGDLPSERALCGKLSIGRGTLRAALSELEKHGEISPAGTKSVRKILKTGKPCPDSCGKNSAPQTIGIITTIPLSELPQSVFLELYLLQCLTEEDGMPVRILECRAAGTNSPQTALTRLTEAQPCVCWILYQTSEATQLWFKKKKLRTIVRGSSFPKSGLPFLDIDWAATIQHASTLLWQKGHRKVLLCVSGARLHGNILMEARFLGLKLPEWEPKILHVAPNPDDFIKDLDEMFLKNQMPTAVIIANGYDIVPLLSWTRRQNIKIPEKLSVITASRQRFMQHLRPRFALYEDSPEKTSRKLKQMIRSMLNGENIRGRTIIPSFSPGETVSVIQK